MSTIPTSPSLNTQLANAVAAVASAQDRLAAMRESTARAMRDESHARDKVNEAQRHFDALVAEVKKSAMRDTEWRKAPGVAVATLEPKP
jgi:chromosome segregation ATPase